MGAALDVRELLSSQRDRGQALQKLELAQVERPPSHILFIRRCDERTLSELQQHQVLALLLRQQTKAHVVDACMTELHTQLVPESFCGLRINHIFYSPVELGDALLIRVVEEDVLIEVVTAGAHGAADVAVDAPGF